jgi:hypothetical protein
VPTCGCRVAITTGRGKLQVQPCHMLVICYVNYLLSISELDLRQIHFSKKALSGRC